jgi:hypothetical protein
MNYMLYKEAIAEKHKKQLVGALGGGALGYLLTRYGLGIKGVGAGLTGAGLGATAGAIGGDYLHKYKQEVDRKEKEAEAKKAAAKEIAGESVLETGYRHAKSPLTYGTGVGAGLFSGYRAQKAIDADLNKRTMELADKLTQATKKSNPDTVLKDKLKSKKIDNILAEKVFDQLKDSGKRHREIDLLKDIPRREDAGRLRRGTVRGKRGLVYGLAAWLAATAGMTTYDRALLMERRRKLLNESNKK